MRTHIASGGIGVGEGEPPPPHLTKKLKNLYIGNYNNAL